LKKIALFFTILFSVFSCKQTESDAVITEEISAQKIEQFGFDFNDFNVKHDTIKKGDTFGSIIENQNLGDKQVYDIISKIKDSFDVRTIRIGRPYTFLRSKDRYKKLQYAIYQPNRANYYVIDLKDSVSVSKVTRPIRIKNRTIAGELNGSFSEELSRQKVDPSVCLVYRFFQIEKRRSIWSYFYRKIY
jgi:hypothetical protein